MEKKITKEQILLSIINAATYKYKLINQKLKSQLLKHHITGLFNRRYLLIYGDNLLKRYNTLYIVDIRNLRTYNEIFGYEIVDQFLKAVAQKIKTFCGKECLLGSLDLGRFWILLHQKEEKEAIEKALSLVEYLTAKEISIKTQTKELSLLLSINVGIGIYPKHGKNIEELLTNAEIAADRAKYKGENTVEIFKEDYRQDIELNLEIEHQLKFAIKHGTLKGEIFPVFQARVNPVNENIVAAEILMRWKKYSPARFIPVAERTGLLRYMFDVLVENSIPVLKEIFKIRPHLRVSFNISPVQLKFWNDLKESLEKLKKADIPLNQIELEITESGVMEEHENIIEKLNSLSLEGFKIVIDDFGKGYSSFERINRLNIFGVKIDRSLLDGLRKADSLQSSKKSVKFIQNLIAFLKSLGYNITIEGVEENEPHLVEIFRKLNVDEIQGFYYAKPVPKEKFLQCLENWEKLKRCKD
ncbi:MAG: phosphodiesterase [Aquificae bacterium]|nr:phosphodiesterase [Aquificota bacterium]